MADTQRLRDPIHGLIVFDKDDETDMLAWRLIQTPEFQRLRRIKQLGISEFVFPGATHSRFSHSIGVYQNARKLMGVVKKSEGNAFKEERARVILIAALLHDLGHGPFSHAFEGAREAIAKSRGIEAIEKHEKFTAKFIQAENGDLRPILDKFDGSMADEIAKLIAADDPTDIYHAVVSSSFDADRLDYLIRDRYMTGTAAGTIDHEWLIDNLATYSIQVQQDDDEPRYVPTFVFKSKGRQAAEDFLLARYRLYTQVYLHKTTRGFEKLISALFQYVATAGVKPEVFGLDPTHPLVRFLSLDGETLDAYRQLDDTVIWGAIECITRSRDVRAAELANRLWRREHLKVLDLSIEYGHSLEERLNAEKRLDADVADQLGISVFKDEPRYNLYSRSGEEAEKAHKMVRVLIGNGGQREITEFEDTIISKNLMDKTTLSRFYFFTAEERDQAEKAMKGR
ncbi:MAG: HD domain-containing protein [Sphingomonadales bacterium]